MKRTVLVVAMLGLMLVVGMQAQKMAIGPSLLWKGGVNVGNIPTGAKTAVNFNPIPDIAATFRMLLNTEESVGFTADLGYAQYTYRMRPESEAIANDNNTFIYKHSFFNIAPSFFLSGFQIGASFGFPLAYSIMNVSGTTEADITAKQTSPNIEVRIGGMIPVFRNKTGSVNFLVHGGYMLTGLMDLGTTDEFNPKAASFGIGVNYLFNLGD